LISPQDQSPSENKIPVHALLSKYVDQDSLPTDSNAEDVRISMNALLDAVDALKSISEVRTIESSLTTASINELIPIQLQFAERRTTMKHPRKSRLQHRIITSESKPVATTNISLASFHQNEQSLSPTPAIVPLRPLSISPVRFVFS
jgi:hypothetical protein